MKKMVYRPKAYHTIRVWTADVDYISKSIKKLLKVAISFPFMLLLNLLQLPLTHQYFFSR